MTKDQKRLLAAYRWVFETVEGKLVLEDLRELYGDRLSYVKGDPHQTSYHEGGRALYLCICQAIEEAKQLERVSNARQRIESKRTIESDSDESGDGDDAN